MPISSVQFLEDYVRATGLGDVSLVAATRRFLAGLAKHMEIELSIAFTSNGRGGLSAHPARVSVGTFAFMPGLDQAFVDSAIQWLSQVAGASTWPTNSLWHPERVDTERPSTLGFGFESATGYPLRLKSYYMSQADANSRMTRYTIVGEAAPSIETYVKSRHVCAEELHLIERLRMAGMRVGDTIRIGPRLLVEFDVSDPRTAVAAIALIHRNARPIAALSERVLTKHNYMACLAVDDVQRPEMSRCAVYFRRRL
jgi:hypothetical protein